MMNDGTNKYTRFTMDDFNRICTDCGLIHTKNTSLQSVFSVKHPLSDKPIDIAVYIKAKDSTEDNPDEFVAVEVSETKYAKALPFRVDFIRTIRTWLLDETQVRDAIKSVTSFLDAEYEARKGNRISLERFFHFINDNDVDRLFHTDLELSCTVQEFLDNMYGVTATIKKGDNKWGIAK